MRRERGLADEALAAAVDVDARYPIPDWGRLMQRVQGKQRVWLEKARGRAIAMQVAGR